MKHRYILRIRSYEGETKVHVWLVEKTGGVEASYLHGECLADTAERMVEALGDRVAVERETRNLEAAKELF